MSLPVLVLENVTKRRTTAQGEEVTLLHSVDLTVETGSFTAIVGPSGGGKSTLVRMLNRLDDPTSGRILFNGQDISTVDPLSLRRKVGLVLQKPYMFEGTARQNLQRPFQYAGITSAFPEEQKLLECLATCQLPGDILDRTARNLSIGQQHRLSLARTILLEPEVLLLDEPTSALDRPTADRLGQTLRQIGQSLRLTIVMVTHDLRLAGRVADRLSYIEDGRLL
ncbi:MAG: ATP-binding cassette domain-containing protein, partial [Desulfuromonadales bacterium]|nr:ATP-binding cassette domain-containing protein [Desulfuromonadales bacterium]NIR33467.1 ATP-binding cassette domain-containing protein [Desulfuromonadales bacterium]NIS43505.1 ATP-binding cassette domain-containing protein [Desulfuromonadales bacterium]